MEGSPSTLCTSSLVSDCVRLTVQPQRDGKWHVNGLKRLSGGWRCSQGAFLDRGQDIVVKRIEQKIADWTMVPVENGEGLQVLFLRRHRRHLPRVHNA